jgi:integrase
VWHEKNRKAALQILETRVLAILNPAPTLAKEKMLVEAMQEYATVQLPNLSQTQTLQFRRAARHMLTLNVALTETESLRIMISEGMQAYQASNNTKVCLLSRLHTFFEFCIRQGWTDKNPAKMVMKPKETKSEVNPFTREEVQRMIAFNREAGHVEFALLLDFLGQTAMRIGETLRLKWSDIDERKIIVDGKGGIEREIPLKPFPRMNEILCELRGLNEIDVFHWNTMPKIQARMRLTCEALSIEPRGFHAIRKMRENEWIDSEGVAPHVAAYLCGHSVAVQEKNYRKKPRAAELEKLLLS